MRSGLCRLHARPITPTVRTARNDRVDGLTMRRTGGRYTDPERVPARLAALTDRFMGEARGARLDEEVALARATLAWRLEMALDAEREGGSADEVLRALGSLDRYLDTINKLATTEHRIRRDEQEQVTQQTLDNFLGTVLDSALRLFGVNGMRRLLDDCAGKLGLAPDRRTALLPEGQQPGEAALAALAEPRSVARSQTEDATQHAQSPDVAPSHRGAGDE